jgi:hypothetical protein
MLANRCGPFLFVCALVLVGCGSGDAIRFAQEGVTHLHSQMDNEQFGDIYSQADDAFRGATKQQDFLDFVGAVHRKLGKVRNASQSGYFVNFSTSGTQVRLNYQTKFEGGDAQEEFVWHVSGKQALLVGYHINSIALITK